MQFWQCRKFLHKSDYNKIKVGITDKKKAVNSCEGGKKVIILQESILNFERKKRMYKNMSDFKFYVNKLNIFNFESAVAKL